MKAVKDASLEELQALSWLPDPVAEAVYKKHPRPDRSCSGPGVPVGDATSSGRPTPAGGRPASPTAPTPSTSSRSCRWRPRPWPGARRVLDVGTGEGQVARLAPAAGPTGSSGVDPTGAQIVEAAPARRGPAYARGPARPRCRSPGPRSTRSSPASCSSTSPSVDEAIGEVARVLVPGGRFALFLNHPLLQTPNSGWIDDQVLDPPEQYWRIGPYLVEDTTIEEVEKGVFIPFIHRPLSRYVNALADAGLRPAAHGGAGPAGGLPRPGHRVPGGRHDPAAARPAHGEGAGDRRAAARRRRRRGRHADVAQPPLALGLRPVRGDARPPRVPPLPGALPARVGGRGARVGRGHVARPARRLAVLAAAAARRCSSSCGEQLGLVRHSPARLVVTTVLAGRRPAASSTSATSTTPGDPLVWSVVIAYGGICIAVSLWRAFHPRT